MESHTFAVDIQNGQYIQNGQPSATDTILPKIRGPSMDSKNLLHTNKVVGHSKCFLCSMSMNTSTKDSVATYDSTYGWLMSGVISDSYGMGEDDEVLTYSKDGKSFGTFPVPWTDGKTRCLQTLDNGGDIFVLAEDINEYSEDLNDTYIFRSSNSTWEPQPGLPDMDYGYVPYGKLIKYINIACIFIFPVLKSERVRTCQTRTWLFDQRNCSPARNSMGSISDGVHFQHLWNCHLLLEDKWVLTKLCFFYCYETAFTFSKQPTKQSRISRIHHTLVKKTHWQLSRMNLHSYYLILRAPFSTNTTAQRKTFYQCLWICQNQ